MTKWLIQSNPNKFDAIEAFKELGKVDWKQGIKTEVDDIVYIYVAAPVKALKLKCKVIEVDLPKAEINDSKYVIEGSSFENYGKYMRLECLKEYDEQTMSFEVLSQHGLKSVQGPMKVTCELESFIDSVDIEEGNLSFEDITDNIVIIKVNKSYRADMSSMELYDVTRGCWKRKIESVKDADYALSVSDSIVREVYRIENWKPSSEVIRETVPNDPETEHERITFTGEVATDDIRSKYLGKNVKNLYKWGEADPVKMIYKYEVSSNKKKLEILDAAQHIEFNSIYEAINACVGTNYTGWMKACYPSVTGDLNYRMWFPKLAKVRNGEKVSAAFDCLNTISDDWNQVVFENLKRDTDYEENPENIYRGYDLIFAKDPDGGYLFRGVFVYDEANSRGNKSVSKRIATKVRMIGNPAEDIELLDRIEGKGINTAMAPKRIVETADGTKYVCAKCGYKLKKAPRCPNCGQLIEYIEE